MTGGGFYGCLIPIGGSTLPTANRPLIGFIIISISIDANGRGVISIMDGLTFVLGTRGVSYNTVGWSVGSSQ